MEEASFSVHILVSEEGDNTDLAAPEAFVLACMSVQCVPVDPSDRMNSVGSVISCVNRNIVGPGCACECDEY